MFGLSIAPGLGKSRVNVTSECLCSSVDAVISRTGAGFSVVPLALALLLPAVFMFATPGVAAAEPENYGYPIADRWAATVVGTPKAYEAELTPLANVPLRKRKIVVIEERDLPDVLFYNRKMLFTYALQKDRDAPVMFLIAGTGAAHNGPKNRLMARAFYERGYHIVSLSSPTYPNFVASASASGVPGHVYKDAEDLYHAMGLAWDSVKGKSTPEHFALTGYSLGGLNAAFVAELDARAQHFNFDNVLLINPPVNLYNSISLLDRMIENIPGGEDNFDQFYNRVVSVFTDVYRRNTDTVGIDETFLAKVFTELQPRDEELAALVGLSFRLSSASLIMTSDLITDYGFIKPRGYELPRYANLTGYRQVATRVGFTDFYHEFFYPFYANNGDEQTRDSFIQSMGLSSITDFLRTTDNIHVIHNADDIILADGELDYVRDVFGSRAMIYPRGGHLGNMAYKENVRHMQQVFTK